MLADCRLSRPVIPHNQINSFRKVFQNKISVCGNFVLTCPDQNSCCAHCPGKEHVRVFVAYNKRFLQINIMVYPCIQKKPWLGFSAGTMFVRVMRTVVKPFEAICIKKNSVDAFHEFLIDQPSGDP